MSGMPKQIQAKHVPDVEFLAVINVEQQANGGRWVMWRDFMAFYELRGVPEKVVYAKARALIRRGLMDGCVHDGKLQCRGDLELTDAGREALRSFVERELNRRSNLISLVKGNA